MRTVPQGIRLQRNDPIRSPIETVTGGVNGTSLRPTTALNGPRTATTLNEEIPPFAGRWNDDLESPHVLLQFTLALFSCRW